MNKQLFSFTLVLIGAVGCSNPTPIVSTVFTDTPLTTTVRTSNPTDTASASITPFPTYTIEPSKTLKSTSTTLPTLTIAPISDTSRAGVSPVSNYLAEGVWSCPDSTAGASFVGSNKSNKLHRLNCEWALKIKAENRICFSDRDAALAYGYIPCGVCKP